MTDCQMIPFPLKARIGKVRRCAEVLRGTANEATRKAYWIRTVQQLTAKLQEIDLSDKDIREEVRSFRAAVQAECLRIEHIEMRASAPDGAA